MGRITGKQKQKMNHELPVDFRMEILRNVLQDHRLEAWKDVKRAWQLHISGGPGSGKSTLATLIARQLRKEKNSAVVHIHVHDDASTAATMLKGHKPACDITIPGSKFVNSGGHIRTEVINVSSSGKDFRELGEVLLKQLDMSEAIYLIIDGYDRAHTTAQEELQKDLHRLQTRGLRVLLLNAASELEAFPPALIVTCNGCGAGDEEFAGLSIYWTCEICDHDLCDPCKATGKHCNDRKHTMREPYSVVNMKLTVVPSELEHFVQVDLKTEYGTKFEDDIVEAICEPSDGNINLVKLRLDQIRDLDAPMDILLPVDRLPREIVAFFDAEIKRINVLDPTQRYQTLVAIRAVAENSWMSVKRLEELLILASGSKNDYNEINFPLVRRAIGSARGLLSSSYFKGDTDSVHEVSDRHRVAPYIRDLGWYVREDYNQDLVLAKQYLIQAMNRERTLDRSHSFDQTTITRKEDSAGSRNLLSQRMKADREASEVSSMGIVDLILQEPGDLCAICLEIMFQSTSNSGVRSWFEQKHESNCPICLYAHNELGKQSLDVLEFHWSRRTMGRIANTNNHLVLTLRSDDLAARPVFRRFMFLLKSELGATAGPNLLGNTTTLEDTGEQIKKWLNTCNTEHVHCNQHQMDYVPKRLVDIEFQDDKEGHELYRVVLKKDKAKGPYVTLSHSWGPNPDFLTLTTENQQRLMTNGFSSKELGNKNFEEAIKVAQHLGVRYIWIDSLCICQGSDGDFKEEGQYMHRVYLNSYCNIVAADSKDGSGGLFRDRHTVPLSGTNATASWIVLDKDLWAKELLQSPIYTRGWVFQERMLSPRIVHFTRSQVFWDCSTVSACETLPEGLPFALSALATTDRRWRGRLQRKDSTQHESSLAVEDSLEKFWKTAVLNYTSCNLTNQSDKTLAIWSVAKLVRDSLQLEDQYGCGLWSIALHEQLAWQVKETKENARMDALLPGFPSWSWASVNAPIQIQDRIAAERCYTVKNHEGAPIGFSEFKDKAVIRDVQPEFVASDSLALHGYLIHGQLRRDMSGGRVAFESAECGFTLEQEVMLDEKPTDALFGPSSFYLMPIVAYKTNEDEITYTGDALMLVRTEDYRKLVHSRLQQHEDSFKKSHGTPYREDESTTGWEPKLITLYYDIKALKAYFKKVAKQDEEMPSRKEKAFRRVGVVRFDSLDAQVWESITVKKEEMIWLD